MRKTVFPFALLVSAFILPITAHADTIDDFAITGAGLNITFSLPASPPGNESTCPTGIITSCLPGSETAFYLSAPVTINGVTEEEGLTFPTLRFGGGLSIDTERFFSSESIYTPDAANPTFTPGTYIVTEFSPTYIPATLTITSETPTAVTPEPSSVTLFMTGVLGLIGLASVRRRSTQP
jgi:PEP-CTERM motif